ncbi:MAG TPA: signal recognition particle receptor subunit alpha, partial [Saprospiraceae bacterium]|nr:signal recognition particle receptor subunit alpha [Saprospiraceae bacterium]
MSFFKKFFSKDKEEDLNKGLEKTKSSIFSQITKAVAGKSKVDVEFLDQLENILISSDVGLDTTVKIIDRLEAKVAEDKYLNTDELNSILKKVIIDILSENNTVDIEDFDPPTGTHPYIIMVVGVNG